MSNSKRWGLGAVEQARADSLPQDYVGVGGMLEINRGELPRRAISGREFEIEHADVPSFTRPWLDPERSPAIPGVEEPHRGMTLAMDMKLGANLLQLEARWWITLREVIATSDRIKGQTKEARGELTAKWGLTAESSANLTGDEFNEAGGRVVLSERGAAGRRSPVGGTPCTS